ncbi:MAG: hypothetical protein H6823_18370 [Planctomycetaceae bacterium]|nr:hypothetical protein [Planctomycetaceae bacterium]
MSSPTSLHHPLEETGRVGNSVCDDTIRQWMEDEGLRLRKIRKDLAGGSHPDRNAQFERIATLIDEYEILGNPYFSVDTKAKEHLGQLLPCWPSSLQSTVLKHSITTFPVGLTA